MSAYKSPIKQSNKNMSIEQDHHTSNLQVPNKKALAKLKGSKKSKNKKKKVDVEILVSTSSRNGSVSKKVNVLSFRSPIPDLIK